MKRLVCSVIKTTRWRAHDMRRGKARWACWASVHASTHPPTPSRGVQRDIRQTYTNTHTRSLTGMRVVQRRLVRARQPQEALTPQQPRHHPLQLQIHVLFRHHLPRPPLDRVLQRAVGGGRERLHEVGEALRVEGPALEVDGGACGRWWWGMCVWGGGGVGVGWWVGVIKNMGGGWCWLVVVDGGALCVCVCIYVCSIYICVCGKGGGFFVFGSYRCGSAPPPSSARPSSRGRGRGRDGGGLLIGCSCINM